MAGEWVPGDVRKQYRMVLTCGCAYLARNVPMRNAFISCPSGEGHGYNNRWVWGKCLKTGRTYENTSL